MKTDINKQYERYFANDEPVPYMPRSIEKRYKFLIKEINEIENMQFRTESLEGYLLDYKKELQQMKPIYIYPVYTKDYIDFYYGINSLLLEKNKISDPKIISMSYLDFLIYMIINDEHGEMYSNMLSTVFELSLHVTEIKYYFSNDGLARLNINNIELDRKDFDNIKKIICYQNMPDFDDNYINPELEEEINKMNELQGADKGTITFEDQKICIMISSPLKLEDIDKLTIRKFIKTLQKVDAKLHYQIYKTGDFMDKDKVTHWMYSKNNKFDSLIKYDSFKNKIQSV